MARAPLARWLRTAKRGVASWLGLSLVACFDFAVGPLGDGSPLQPSPADAHAPIANLTDAGGVDAEPDPPASPPPAASPPSSDRDAGSSLGEPADASVDALVCGSLERACCGGLPPTCDLGLGCNGAARCERCARFVALEPLPSEIESVGGALSADGNVVSGWSVDALGLQRAVRWSAAGAAPEALGVLAAGVPGNTRALGVNDDGSLIVGSGEAFLGDSPSAFIWRAATGLLRLTSGAASGVSADGSVVVGSLAPDQAFRWTLEQGIQRLPFFFGEDTGESRARAISADGAVVVGETSGLTGARVAFLWTEAGGITALDLYAATVSSSATSASADGTVIVGVRQDATGPRIFRWTAPLGIEDLLPAEGADEAPVTTANGALIVANSLGVPVLWDATTRQARPLTEVFGSLVLPGFQLGSVVSTSADGRVFSGNGLDAESRPRAWVAVTGVSCAAP